MNMCMTKRRALLLMTLIQEQEILTNTQPVENAIPSHVPVLIFGENDEKYLASMPSMKRKEILDLFPDEERNVTSQEALRK